MRKRRVLAAAVGLVVFGVGVAVGGLVVWAGNGAEVQPVEPPVVAPTTVPVPVSGWVDDSEGQYPRAVLHDPTYPLYHAALTVFCILDAGQPAVLDVTFEAPVIPYEDVGSASWVRWAFVTDGIVATSSENPAPYITAELFHSLTTADQLIVEMDVMGGTGGVDVLEITEEGRRWAGTEEWRQPGEIYPHRATYDLQGDDTALRAVVDRCGLSGSEDW